jgi:hypothetical protein
MRLRTDIFVSALTRRAFGMGGFAAVERKGAEEAGAIFVRHRLRDGREDLYGPAPQMLLEDDGVRRFEKRLAGADAGEVDAMLERERRFDSDLWIVELDVETVPDQLLVTGTGA